MTPGLSRSTRHQRAPSLRGRGIHRLRINRRWIPTMAGHGGRGTCSRGGHSGLLRPPPLQPQTKKAVPTGLTQDPAGTLPVPRTRERLQRPKPSRRHRRPQRTMTTWRRWRLSRSPLNLLRASAVLGQFPGLPPRTRTRRQALRGSKTLRSVLHGCSRSNERKACLRLLTVLRQRQLQVGLPMSQALNQQQQQKRIDRQRTLLPRSTR
jgi:hypothetical protein